ncbi:MAG: TetR/AcrR family transcriptional regulator [Dehalococcoidia bacterium]
MTTRAPALPAEDRRAAIIAATLPLMLERGASVTTKQIAEAAGIAEGTIFGVFPDKQAVVQAALQAAFDPEPTERQLRKIDRSKAFEAQLEEAVQILQRRLADIWRLITSFGEPSDKPSPPNDSAALADLLRAGHCQLRTDPALAARQLRALTMALSHPVLFAGEPMPAKEIVSLLLDGIRLRDNAGEGGGRP